jgi:lipid-A-disaccharide synthase
MLIAGEASGDLLAAELVLALRRELLAAENVYEPWQQPLRTALEPRFFGAGGPRMKAAGVELAFDMTQHSVIGLSDVLKSYFKFRRLFNQLYRLALERTPDAIICVDFSGFNRRFAHAIRKYVHRHQDWFHPWNPKIIQYVSPQVWASREGRAYLMAEDFDLVVSHFPFEKDWYAQRVPKLRVEYVGHPMVERFASEERVTRVSNFESGARGTRPSDILLLPGSRPDELQRHLPVMLDALKQIRAEQPDARAKMVLPDESLANQARASSPNGLEIQIGNLRQALAKADVAIASTGTVTLECAFFGVPTVAIYKTSRLTYEIAKRIVKVKYLAMPNLLANEEIFPEFIQDAATPEHIARSALDLLRDEPRRTKIKARLAEVVASLGGPGATERAARAIARLLKPESAP